MPLVDPWAKRLGDLARVIFEVKGLSTGNEVAKCRAALSQLLQDRCVYGADEDRLCFVVDRPIADRRRRAVEVGVLIVTEHGQLQPIGQLAMDIIGTEGRDVSSV